jgi:hypothetical protein
MNIEFRCSDTPQDKLLVNAGEHGLWFEVSAKGSLVPCVLLTPLDARLLAHAILSEVGE